MNISLDIPRPMSLRFLIAAFRGRRSLGLNSDRDTEVEDPDQETEVDDFAEVDDDEEYEDEGYDYNSHPPKHPRKWIEFPKLGCAPTSILLLLLLLLVIGLSTFFYVQWSHAQTQNYLDINGIIQVAQVRVIDPAIARVNTPDAKDINGGNDGYFELAQEQGLLAFLGVAAAYTKTVTVPADGHTYNVYMSQNGLFIKTAD